LPSYKARNDEIRDNITRMRREWEAQRGALATVRRFNAIMSTKGKAWFWPTIGAALVSKHHWLNCDSCGTVIDLDLRVKPRDPEASVTSPWVTFNARDATGMGGRASLRWRNTRQFDPRQNICRMAGPPNFLATDNKTIPRSRQ